jgi:hypothetical protein
MLFGGEGLFFASLTGPGRVWLQTLPFSRLADRINAAQRGDREEVKRDARRAGRSHRRRQVSPLAGNMGFFAGSRPACCRHGAAPGAAGE